MARKCYDFSGITLGISCDEPLHETDNVKKFAADCAPQYEIALQFTDDMPVDPDCAESSLKRAKLEANKPEQIYAYTEFHGSDIKMYATERYRGSFGVDSVLRNLPLSHLLLNNGAVIMHGAYIISNGEAIVFSAPSGTGKSTQAELWRKERGAAVINGDRVLIRRGDNGFTAGGIHYCGTSGICENVTAPLRAVVLLGQAAKNSVCRCPGSQALRRMLPECACCTDFTDEAARLVMLLSELINSVAVLKFDCLPDKSAVEALTQCLYGECK